MRLKNRTARLLKEASVEYDNGKLHRKKFFGKLLDKLDYVPDSFKEPTMSRGSEAFSE